MERQGQGGAGETQRVPRELRGPRDGGRDGEQDPEQAEIDKEKEIKSTTRRKKTKKRWREHKTHVPRRMNEWS